MFSIAYRFSNKQVRKRMLRNQLFSMLLNMEELFDQHCSLPYAATRFLRSPHTSRFGPGTTKCSISICFDDCSTTDQMAQSPSSSPRILPDFKRERSSRPASILAAVFQASIPCFTQIGTATVRMRPPLPRRSIITHLPSRSRISSMLREASSRRRSAQPTRRAMIT